MNKYVVRISLPIMLWASVVCTHKLKILTRLQIKMLVLSGKQQKCYLDCMVDHEIFSTIILSLPLIQEGHLTVSGERMCTILVNHLED